MSPIRTTELQGQATQFAREMVAFIEEENAHAQSPNAALSAPQDMSKWFEVAYMRFVARHRLIQP